MSETNYTPIQLYRTTTASLSPSAGNLADGELGINLTDEKLYFKNAGGTVKLLAANLMPVANGGTGVTTSTGSGSVVLSTSPTLVTPTLSGVTLSDGTANGVLYLNGSKVATSGSVLTFDGSKLSYKSATMIKSLSAGTSTFSSGAYGVLSFNEDYSAGLCGIFGGTSYGYLRLNVPTGADIGFNINGSTAMTLDSSGNLGLGVTPSAWGSSFKAIDVGANQAALAGFGNNLYLTTNSYYNGANWIYKTGSYAQMYQMSAGQHQWYIAPSGTAGNAIDFTQAMTLDSSGNLGIGATAPTQKLSINGVGGTLAGTAAISLWDGNSGGSRRWCIANGASAAGVSQIGALTFNVGSGSYTADPLSAGVEVMRLDSSGNLGIGTASPTAKLQVSSNTASAWATIISQQNTGGHGQYISMPSGTTGIPWMVNINSSPAAQIDSSGNLLVGTTSSSARLMLVPDAAYNLCIRTNPLGSTLPYTFVKFNNTTSAVGSIVVDSTSTSYNTSSDYRLKEDYQPVTDAIARLNQLKPINFKWKSEDRRCDGFLAHELQEVIPEAATGHKDETKIEEYEVTPAIKDEEGNVITEAVMGEREVPIYQGIDQSKIVPLLTAALQEAVAKIESLTQRIEALEYKGE